MAETNLWNRCDECGRLIALDDFWKGIALRQLVEPDNEFGPEKYETLCKQHYVPANSAPDVTKEPR